jgi:hypothetical protein
LSLDLSTVQRDFVSFYRRDRWEYGHLGFLSQLSPAIRVSDKNHGFAEREPIRLSERMIDMQLEQLQDLVEVDRSHREIVSSAASIGAAISASRLGRAATTVAFATLIVAVSTLLVTSFDPNAPLVKFWHWIGV